MMNVSAANNNNNNNNAGPSAAQVMRAALIKDKRVHRTMKTKTGDDNKQVSADGCIVPRAALSAKKPIVLTDAGKVTLFTPQCACACAQ